MDSPDTYLTPAEKALMEKACVGIAGAGGLGSNCAMLLVRAGVRRLVIADFDTVAPSNLNRQFYFRRQIGMKKTAALAENLREIAPDTELELHDTRIERCNVRDIFAKCDIIVEAFDNAESKAMLVGEMAGGGKPLVAASGIAGWGRSGDMALRKIGANLYMAGDCESGVGGDLSPHGPRVAIAAAMQANTVAALILGQRV